VSDFRAVAHTRLIAICPLVKTNETIAWEDYSIANQGWIEESYKEAGIGATVQEIHPKIYEVNNAGIAVEAKEGPFMPLWQLSSPPEDITVVNFDLLSSPVFSKAYDVARGSQEALFTEIIDDTNILHDGTEEDNPESIVLHPMFEETTFVASIVSIISWNSFVNDLFHQNMNGMIVVLKNSCGQTYTYNMDEEGANLIGEGDHHEAEFDQLAHAAEVAPFLEIDSEADVCRYFLHIYPSEKLESELKSKTPVILASAVALLFLFAAVGFYAYDVLAVKKQREAAETAAQSNAIVNSLFPSEIRDRLFNEEHGGQEENVDAEALDAFDPSVPSAQRFRLKNYLQEADPSGKMDPNEDITESKPIADLFPYTTVLFADISGFTAWSSVREPSQVFTLLESVYKAFDTIAKRRRVFKVETVGDCYVAVTGLPEPNKEHAVIMCRFARECQSQFNELVKHLEVLLGPDTAELGIRIGLHSGPVTAGVLRGAKSRFQLFGDTVNTAARIETTGRRDKIHLSQETAELVIQAGKSKWMIRRNDTVVAKGKGEMQTYWLLSEAEVESGIKPEISNALPVVNAMQPRLAKAAMNVLDPESSLPPKIKRLVDWNVDVLKRLLKQVVIKREQVRREQFDITHPTMMKTEMNIGCDTYVLDEVVEIIRLPGYSNIQYQHDISKIEIPKEAEKQLRLYVSSIAAMHRGNHFHNFEHASHVMMSVSKLLSRIVAPDEVLHGNGMKAGLEAHLHDHTYGITSDPLTQFSVVLAALIHDVDHSGVSNFQLIKEKAKIANVFRNKSVAEQNSIVLSWDRLMESRFTALRSCIYSDPDELKRFRQLLVNTVLATDIFDKELQTIRKVRWDKAFANIVQQKDEDDDVNRKATIVIEHLIQASDVAHTMQHWHIYQKWNERLFAEMTVAYQNDRMGKDPGELWYKGELGFFDNYIIPLAKKLKECGVFGVSSDEYLNYALENRREWASKGEEVVENMIKQYSLTTGKDS
jgi:class 3 adenylate cyclase